MVCALRVAVDMFEIYERVSIRAHGSILVHGAVFKVSRDMHILNHATHEAFRLSKLELDNAWTNMVQGGDKQASLFERGWTDTAHGQSVGGENKRCENWCEEPPQWAATTTTGQPTAHPGAARDHTRIQGRHATTPGYRATNASAGERRRVHERALSGRRGGGSWTALD